MNQSYRFVSLNVFIIVSLLVLTFMGDLVGQERGEPQSSRQTSSDIQNEQPARDYLSYAQNLYILFIEIEPDDPNSTSPIKESDPTYNSIIDSFKDSPYNKYLYRIPTKRQKCYIIKKIKDIEVNVKKKYRDNDTINEEDKKKIQEEVENEIKKDKNRILDGEYSLSLKRLKDALIENGLGYQKSQYGLVEYIPKGNSYIKGGDNCKWIMDVISTIDRGNQEPPRNEPSFDRGVTTYKSKQTFKNGKIVFGETEQPLKEFLKSKIEYAIKSKKDLILEESLDKWAFLIILNGHGFTTNGMYVFSASNSIIDDNQIISLGDIVEIIRTSLSVNDSEDIKSPDYIFWPLSCSDKLKDDSKISTNCTDIEKIPNIKYYHWIFSDYEIIIHDSYTRNELNYMKINDSETRRCLLDTLLGYSPVVETTSTDINNDSCISQFEIFKSLEVCTQQNNMTLKIVSNVTATENENTNKIRLTKEAMNYGSTQ